MQCELVSYTSHVDMISWKSSCKRLWHPTYYRERSVQTQGTRPTLKSSKENTLSSQWTIQRSDKLLPSMDLSREMLASRELIWTSSKSCLSGWVSHTRDFSPFWCLITSLLCSFGFCVKGTNYQLLPTFLGRDLQRSYQVMPLHLLVSSSNIPLISLFPWSSDSIDSFLSVYRIRLMPSWDIGFIQPVEKMLCFIWKAYQMNPHWSWRWWVNKHILAFYGMLLILRLSILEAPTVVHRSFMEKMFTFMKPFTGGLWLTVIATISVGGYSNARYVKHLHLKIWTI